MPNYDDLFTGQPTQQEEKPFDKTVWAARKQAEREGVYAMIDSYVQDMGREGGLFQAYLDVQARFDLYSGEERMLSPFWNRVRSTSGTMAAWACPTMCGRSLTFPRPGPPSAPPPPRSGMNACC